jgi:hypothetical protein
MKTTIYTNGKSLFTLENYGKTAGVCYVHGITIHSEVSKLKSRQMHSLGSLFYIFGTGDKKELFNLKLSRKTKLNNFQVF